MMQLIRPTPMSALRQARNASPSSERRTPATPAIDPNLFKLRDSPIYRRIKKTRNKQAIVANLGATVQRSHVNLNVLLDPPQISRALLAGQTPSTRGSRGVAVRDGRRSGPAVPPRAG